MTLTRREESCNVVSHCRSCQDPIFWVEWPRSGKRMPIDALPTATGDIVVIHRKSENKLFAEKFVAELHKDRKRYTSHFATCVNADQHRGGK